MHSFKEDNPKIPLGSVWLMNSISEFKGKQDIYTKQSPQILKSMIEIALIESAESSNRIEGITVEKNRLKPLIIGKSKPRDRSEEEVADYRKALDWIHKKYASLRISPEVIQELHCLCRGESWDAGKWKDKDNNIVKKHANGCIEVIFKPLSSKETPRAMEQLCLVYENSITQLKYPDLYSIACLILDFLSIHPFRDGNGRVSRLLMLLALYQHNYQVGKYISLERIIEQSKETYYETLNKSSQKWHQAKHDIYPWFNYFLGTILDAYKEFEQRAGTVKPARGAKTSIVEHAIKNQVGKFTLSDIIGDCPSVSRDMVRNVFKRLAKQKRIQCLGKGQSAKWELVAKE
ncbi:MAG: Fic family protein [Elusimicrobia bacterium]|nr:Fic family protein [Elusimicrobiota bacterium]